jgi:hypothetical protein
MCTGYKYETPYIYTFFIGYRMSVAFDTKPCRIYARGPVVDLQLAQTYVPGLYCLLRSSILILTMTRSNMSEDMSFLLIASIIVYVDRTFRNESIFDSNAVTMSILVAHMFNLIRIREVPAESHFVIVYADSSMGLTKLGMAVQVIYCVVSILVVFDYNIGCSEVASAKPLHDHGFTTITIITHAILMSTMVFIHINVSSMGQPLIISRSLSFTVLSILWSYIVGVRNTVNALHAREDCKVIPVFPICPLFAPNHPLEAGRTLVHWRNTGICAAHHTLSPTIRCCTRHRYILPPSMGSSDVGMRCHTVI